MRIAVHVKVCQVKEKLDPDGKVWLSLSAAERETNDTPRATPSPVAPLLPGEFLRRGNAG